jgi:hypothetical protein
MRQAAADRTPAADRLLFSTSVAYERSATVGRGLPGRFRAAVTQLKYYEVLSYFTLACILESRYQRVTSTGFHDPAGATAEWTVPALTRP